MTELSAIAYRSDKPSYDPDDWITVEVHASGRRIEIRTLAKWRLALSTTPDAPLAVEVLGAVEQAVDEWHQRVQVHAESVAVQ